MQTQDFIYFQDDVRFQGYCAWQLTSPAVKKPAILIVHDWSGCNEFAKNKAQEIAKLGYVGIAIDMYGAGRVGQTDEEKQVMIKPLKADRNLVQKRIQAAYEAAKHLPQVQAAEIGAIGFCFGGLCALDLARSGIDVKGVVSFHGLLQRPADMPLAAIQSKILVLHGYEDPLVPPDQLAAFEREMVQSGADWQVHVYGRVQHSFTNPAAHNMALGLAYNEQAANRAWDSMKLFFHSLFPQSSL